ncbi:universal stress protein [Dehalococcoidia bacterium]|nr:universal stress protein [Dehalococcoidia bacterium]MCL0070694.1 universal stress protein [Dehalococcoidia bacterium]
MFTKILVPLDGSELAEHILQYVRAVATGCNVSGVILLRIVEPLEAAYSEIGADWRREWEERIKAEAEDYISKMADNLKKEGVAAEGVVALGRPADGILEYTKNNQVDLIVMSTHGRSGPSRWLFGSVAERVLRHSTAPVLVAAPPAFRE